MWPIYEEIVVKQEKIYDDLNFVVNPKKLMTNLRKKKKKKKKKLRTKSNQHFVNHTTVTKKS